MNAETPFGTFVRQRRREMDLTQEELARRVGCAAITLRKIEAEDLRPSVQIAERLAMALAIPLEERSEFVRRARAVHPESAELPAVTPPPSMDEIGREDLTGRAIRGYALAERIGMGGMGSVYRAVQPNVEREVAVKIILPAFANHPDFIRRFEAEAQLVARLEHPHIVPLYDYWREPGVAYLVMRLLRGGNVHDLLGGGPLPLEMTGHMLEQICSALNAAHRIGVIHRDLKPANVLLDEDRNAYLADFGIAKNLGNPDLESQTGTDAMLGSPQYMSPEQIRSLSVRPQTDIYCLGVMLYEMLTGALPFSGPTPIDLIQQHLNTPMPPLAARTSGLPASLDAVIGQATAKEPQERYADTLTFYRDFRRAISGMLDSRPIVIEAEEDELDLEMPNPFKGLHAFGEADSENFFGRETLVQQLLARLGEGGDLSRFLAVIGPSGSGKSSVVRAGLIPALRRGGLPGSENWFIVDMLPGKHPFEELEAALLRVAVNPPPSLLAQLKDGKRGLLRAVHRILPADESVELVLVIDQFEEVFTLVEEEAERALLLESLATAALDERSRLRVLITLRADFTDKPLRYVDFGELLNRRFEFVLPLTPDELERAIAGPSQRAGLRLEKGLVSTIIRDVGNQPGGLPLLQYALSELFDKREGRRLTNKAYHEIGGVAGALGRRAEAIYADLDEAGGSAARQLFLRLVTLGEGTEDTRRRVLHEEIEALYGDQQGAVQKAIEAFGKARLLSFDRDPLTRAATIEVAHEALLREWPRLRDWLSESRSDVRMQRQLAGAAAEWHHAGEDASYLLAGAKLEQFEGWAGDTSIALTQTEREFLEASVAERDRHASEERARRRRELEAAQKLAETERARAEEGAISVKRLRRRAISLAGVLALAVIAMLAAGFFANSNGVLASRNAAAAATAQLARNEALDAQATAQGERDSAEVARADAFSRELAAQSRLTLDKDPELSILLALQAYAASTSKEALDALHEAVLTSRVIKTIRLDDGYIISDIAFSPDGQRFATAGGTDFDDTSLRVWDAGTAEELLTLKGPSVSVAWLSFSPDGTQIASAGYDGTVKLWDLATGKERLSINIGIEQPATVHFGPDGTWLVADAGESRVRFWDTATGAQLFELSSPDWTSNDPPLGVAGVKLSSDGTSLAISLCTEDIECRVEIWDVPARRREQILFQGGNDFSWNGAMAFSPDNSRLALIRTNRDASPGSVWDLATGRMLYQFSAGFNQVSFSDDGSRLFSATGGGKANVWDAETGQALITLVGHKGIVTVVAANRECPTSSGVSTCGTRLVSAGRDGTLKIWDITADGRGEGLVLPSAPFAVGPDWSHVTTVAGSEEKPNMVTTSYYRWAIPGWTQEGLSRLSEPDTISLDSPADNNFTPSDANWWLEIARDGTIRFLDLAAPGGAWTSLCCFDASGDNSLASSSLSADGKLLAVAGTNGVVQFWDVPSDRELEPLNAYGPDEIGRVALSPDGKLLAAGGPEGLIKIWDLATRRLQTTLPELFDLTFFDFSPDGNSLGIGSCGGAPIYVRDVTTGEIKARLQGHTGCVGWLAFSPDGTRMASSSPDQTTRIWDLKTGKELLALPVGGWGGYNLAFSPDGKVLLGSVSSSNSSAFATRSFLLDPADLVALAKSRLTRSLTTEECQKYLHVEQCPVGP